MIEPTIHFAEAAASPIKAGKSYKIKITQQVTELDAAKAQLAGGIDRRYQHVRTVHVQGERFSVDPQDIVAVYPPDGSVGDLNRVLPNITFSRKTLPWEQSAGAANTPWLALLVFHEHDPGGIPKVVPAMVGDLLRAPFSPGPSLDPRDSTQVSQERMNRSVIASYADASPEWRLMPGDVEVPSQPCMIMDVPVVQFRALAPTKGDLQLLAHSRVVTDQDVARAYATVLANRVPPVGNNMAALVSVEGMAPFLAPASNLSASTTHVRLIVLKTWRFRHDQDLLGFHRPLSSGPLNVPYLAPSAPAMTAEDVLVQNALAMGYTALDHHTRWGDRTASWYRGPLLPFSSAVTISVPLPPICADGYVTGALPLSSADEALRYDPELGMLDASYASAWQLGRLLALRDKTFSYDLYAWKQDTRRKVFAAGAAAERAGHAGQLRSPDGVASHADAREQTPTDGGANLLFAFLADMIKPALDALAARDDPESPDPPDPFGSEGGGDDNHRRARRMKPKQSAQALFKDSARLKAHVEHAGVRAPPSVVAGLEKLRRLEGVPLDYLVPDERMLPTESLRFFQVDLNWVYSLVEGAYSVARVSAQDQLQDAATCPHDTYHQLSGFLVRSSLISEWPGLQVLTEVSNPTAPCRTLRCERIAPDILLCLVEVEGPGVITSVTFQVPADHLEFHLPIVAVCRPGFRSVVDIEALALALGTQGPADFAYKLSPLLAKPPLTWNDERGVVIVDTTSLHGLGRWEGQFVANGQPFGPRLACQAAGGKVELTLNDELPAGRVAVRLRPIGADPQLGAAGRWVTSQTLRRPSAALQPVLGYSVAQEHITAQWPAGAAGTSFETRLRYTSPYNHQSTDVGPVKRHAAASASAPVHAVIAIGNEKVNSGQPVGQVQLRFRTVPTDPHTLPGAWATSTQGFTRLSGPMQGVNQGESRSQLLFFVGPSEAGKPGYGEMELRISTDAADPSQPVYTARGTGDRVLFDVKPEYLATPTYSYHARFLGKDDLFISSAWFSRTPR